MKRTIISIILVLFLAIAIVNATSLEQGKIVYNNIATNYGTVYVAPSIINETINAGKTISQEIKINLSTELTKEFNVTVFGGGAISSWINVEKENFIIKKGENLININISIPSNAETKKYSGFIIMNNENIDYNLVDIYLDIKSNSGGITSVGTSSGGGGGREITPTETGSDCKETSRTCTGWSECTKLLRRSRSCQIVKDCNGQIQTELKWEEQPCEYKEPTETVKSQPISQINEGKQEQKQEEQGFFSRMWNWIKRLVTLTGATITDGGNKIVSKNSYLAYFSIFIIIVLFLVIRYKIYKKG